MHPYDFFASASLDRPAIFGSSRYVCTEIAYLCGRWWRVFDRLGFDRDAATLALFGPDPRHMLGRDLTRIFTLQVVQFLRPLITRLDRGCIGPKGEDARARKGDGVRDA
jgi:hypothetical protein